MKKLKALSGTLLFVVGIILIVYALWNMASTALLRRTFRQQLKDGLPMRLADVMPPPAAPEDNAAPLLEQAFTRLHRLKPDALLKLDSADGQPSEFHFPVEGLDIVQRAQLAEAVRYDALKPVFAALKESVTRPACDFGLDYTRGAAARMPHLAYLRKAVRLVGLRAWVESGDRRAKEALADITTALRLAAFLQPQPLMASQLVYADCDIATVTHLNAVLRRLPLNAAPDADLQAVADELDAHLHPAVPGAVRAMDGERILLAKWFFERAISGEVSMAAVAKIGPVQADLPAWLFSFVWRPFLKSDYRHYLLVTAETRALLADPSETIGIFPVDPHSQPPYCVVTRRAAASLATFVGRVAGHRTYLRLGRLGVLLEQHRRSTGAYPNALAELAAPDALVTDPFTGASFVYRKTDRGFVLYSLGPNRIDDGGTAFDADNRIADLVWEI